eukprot:COSAG01_NODE_2477_length_7615_cov_7.259609_6_plen_149_part_00
MPTTVYVAEEQPPEDWLETGWWPVACANFEKQGGEEANYAPRERVCVLRQQLHRFSAVKLMRFDCEWALYAPPSDTCLCCSCRHSESCPHSYSAWLLSVVVTECCCCRRGRRRRRRRRSCNHLRLLHRAAGSIEGLCGADLTSLADVW